MKLAVVLYVRNEARALPEWVAYHRVLGFDAFLIYDNLSDDPTPEVLRRLGRHADVRVRRWDRTDPEAQRAAYQDALDVHGPAFDWLLFIDADEFFLPVLHDTAQGFLATLPESRAVALNWAMFGSSGLVDYPEGLVIESFTRRAPDDFPANRHVKSLVRPDAVVRAVCPHVAEVRGGYTDATGRPVEWISEVRAPPQLGVCRVNHYFTRSRAHWADKLRRGYRDIVRPDEHFALYDRNEVLDETALRFAPAVRSLLHAWDV